MLATCGDHLGPVDIVDLSAGAGALELAPAMAAAEFR